MSVVSARLAVLFSSVIVGCSIDVSGLGEADASSDAGVDARVDAAGIDAGDLDGGGRDATPDAGPPPDSGCHAWDSPRAVYTLVGDWLEERGSIHLGTAYEPPGVLVIPAQPFRRGGLLARGYDGDLLGAPPMLSGVSGTPTGHAFLGDLDLDFEGTDAPAGLLLAGRDRYTVVAEGQIRLLAGPTTVVIEADDRGVIEIDVDGTTHRAAATGSASAGTVTFTAPADRWYPVRLGWADAGGNSDVRVTVAEGTDDPFVPGPDVLRAQALSIDGREMMGFDAAPPGSTVAGTRIDPDDTDQSWGDSRPEGVGITSNDVWSVRWLSRWTFDAPDGTMRADTDGKHRLWVHGVYYGGEYATGVANVTYAPRVAPGTNDVVYELDEMTGAAFARVYLNDATVTSDRTRPVTRFGGLAFGAGTRAGPTPISAGGMRTVDVDVAAPSSPPPTVAEISGVIETTEPDAITLRYTPPEGGGTTAPLRDWGEPAGGDRWVFRHVIPTPFDTSGTWVVGATNASSTTATLHTAGVLVHHGADARPYAAEATWISAALDLGARTRVTSLELDAHSLFGTSVELSVGAADDASGLPSPWWHSARPDGTVDGDAAGRWVQVRAVLRGPGVDTPRVEEIRVVGGACVP